MEGTIPSRQLTARRKAGIAFNVAQQSDDFEIRRLLRDTPTAGRISLSFEREPDYFREPATASETKQTIVARRGSRIVCVGSCAIRERFVNGKARRVGYLGGLRLDSSCAGRFDILRRGYDYFHQLQQDDPADFYFTSIAADNIRARKFLEHPVRGMPQYEFLSEFVTLMIPTRGATVPSANAAPSQSAFPQELSGFLNSSNHQYQFAPFCSPEDLQLLDSEFCVLRDGQEIKACGTVWDQRRFKQVVIRSYSPSLKTMRPLVNVLSRWIGTPRLPAVGEVLSNAFACHLAAATTESLVELMRELAGQASKRGIEFVTTGFASNDPRLAIVRNHFRAREYHSRLYVVEWPDIGTSASQLDDRIVSPEVALL